MVVCRVLCLDVAVLIFSFMTWVVYLFSKGLHRKQCIQTRKYEESSSDYFTCGRVLKE